MKWRSAAPVAAAFEQFAVHVDDAHRPCLLVKIVHILGAEEKTIFQLLFELRQREVRWIRLRFRSNPPPHGVELPYQPGITSPSMGRGDLFNPVVAPKTAHATECWNAALGTHSCSREDEHAVKGRNGGHG